MAGLGAGVAASGILDGSPLTGITASGAQATLWHWNGRAWVNAGTVDLAGEIAGPGALETVDVTEANDLLVRLAGNRGSILLLADGEASTAAFATPDGASTVAAIGAPQADEGTVAGTLDGVEAPLTWRYDARTDRFEVQGTS